MEGHVTLGDDHVAPLVASPHVGVDAHLVREDVEILVAEAPFLSRSSVQSTADHHAHLVGETAGDLELDHLAEGERWVRTLPAFSAHPCSLLGE